MRIRRRDASDLAEVIRLLEDAGLPLEGLDLTEGWVFEVQGTVIGHLAVEPTADALVVRSLVVDPAHRGKGLGGRLMAEAEVFAMGRVLVLRTGSLGPWVERRGYAQAALSQVPPSIRASSQFSGTLCSSTPIYLKGTADPINAAVRESYAVFLERTTGCCGPASKGCGCSGILDDPSLKLGYALQDVQQAPEGANLGFGCGNPVALASLKPGETVLDLGSGTGFDAFLAARRMGPTGRVIGIVGESPFELGVPPAVADTVVSVQIQATKPPSLGQS